MFTNIYEDRYIYKKETEHHKHNCVDCCTLNDNRLPSFIWWSFCPYGAVTYYDDSYTGISFLSSDVLDICKDDTEKKHIRKLQEQLDSGDIYVHE